MSDATRTHARSFHPQQAAPTRPPLPWQLWVVIIALGIEGMGNFMSMFSNPAAALWLAWKCLFITGFFLRWRPVYVLFLVMGMIHFIGFSTSAPFIAAINLVLVIFVASTKNYFLGAH